MKLAHINKIKANIALFSNKKTTNILDGTYKSVYKGRSMDFENLRNYVIGDDVKDIDWKSSARSGDILIKQFIAEKKHNIAIIMDSGAKMEADTDQHENKRSLALDLAGTIGYIAIRNGDFVTFSYADKGGIVLKPFKSTLYNLEECLCAYEKEAGVKTNLGVGAILENVYKHIKRKMIIFIISDFAGVDSLDGKLLKRVTGVHDVLVISLNDNFMTGDDVYDIEKGNYISKLFSRDKKLHKVEQELRTKIINENAAKVHRAQASFMTIGKNSEINTGLVKLLEEHRYANSR